MLLCFRKVYVFGKNQIESLSCDKNVSFLIKVELFRMQLYLVRDHTQPLHLIPEK
jgi:hypothetical protein